MSYWLNVHKRPAIGRAIEQIKADQTRARRNVDLDEHKHRVWDARVRVKSVAAVVGWCAQQLAENESVDSQDIDLLAIAADDLEKIAKRLAVHPEIQRRSA